MRRLPFLLALLAAAGPAAARDGDLQGFTPLARHFEGLPHRVVYRDPFAFVGLDTGVAIFDLTDPRTPQRLSHLYLPSPAYDLVVSGNNVYVACGESGLLILDVTTLSAPRIAGSLRTEGARAVALAGVTAFIAEASGPAAAVHGLRAIDVSSSSAPFERDFLPLSNGALAVAVAGGVVFVGTGSELGLPHALVAVNASNPDALSAIGSLATGRSVHDIELAGGVAWLATGFASTGEILAVNISTPAAMSVLGDMPLTDAALGLALDGTTLYAAARVLGLLSLDVTDPTAPSMLDAMPTGRETVAVAVLPGIAILAERSSIERAALSIADTTFPGNVRPAAAVAYAEATGARAGGGKAYLLERGALHVFDATTPSALVEQGRWEPPSGDFSALDVQGNTAAVAEGTSAHLVDVTDPVNPVSLGTAPLGDGVAVAPVLAGDRLYLVNGRGFESFDITNRSAPTPLAVFSTPGWSADLAIAGSSGFLVAGDTLYILDLSASMLPVQIQSVTIPGESLFGVDTDGTLAVATGYSRMLYIFDVSAPATPTLLAAMGGTGGFAVRLSGTRAVVASGTGGLRLIDLTTPSSPTLEGWFDTSGSSLALDLDGQDLYLATNEAQHQVLLCPTCQDVCNETWPAIGANSLQLAKLPVNQTLYWTLASGAGDFNVHRTLLKAALPTLYQDSASLIGTTGAQSFSDGFAPAPGESAYYKVYPRGSCSGASIGP